MARADASGTIGEINPSQPNTQPLGTMASAIRVLSVNTSLAQPLLIDGRLVATGIRKSSRRDEAVSLSMLGLQGDEQADLSVHGGLSKAVYAYPSEHLPFWDAQRAANNPSKAELSPLEPGAMGENLSLQGLLETELWIGDELMLPHATLVVSEPRYPCFKFGAVMGNNQAVKAMVTSGHCGAYLAVRQPGHVRAGDAIELRPGPREVRLLDLFFGKARA
jgi:MOSC domain-containing protein YiiM